MFQTDGGQHPGNDLRRGVPWGIGQRCLKRRQAVRWKVVLHVHRSSQVQPSIELKRAVCQRPLVDHFRHNTVELKPLLEVGRPQPRAWVIKPNYSSKTSVAHRQKTHQSQMRKTPRHWFFIRIHFSQVMWQSKYWKDSSVFFENVSNLIKRQMSSGM